MKVIPLSELKGKTVKDTISISARFMAVVCTDNTLALIRYCVGASIRLDDGYENRRDADLHRWMKDAGLTTDEELAAEILAETHAADIAQYNALKAKLGL